MIPTQLLSDSSLQPSDRILFGYIYWMTKLALMRCVAGNDTLAELTGLSIRGVQQSLVRLEQQGYIRRIFIGKGDRHRENIECLLAYSALSPKIERTNVRTRTNKRAYPERTNVHHNKKREEEHLNKLSTPIKKNSKKGLQTTSDNYPELKLELDAFIEVRQAMCKPLTPSSLKLLVDKLERWYPSNTKNQRLCLEQSIINGWQGIFELKDEAKIPLDVSPAQLLHPEKYGRPSDFAAKLSEKMDVNRKLPPR